MIEDGTPRSSPKGTVFGCLSAFAVFVCAGFVLLFAVAWSGAHCEPVPNCQHENEHHFLWQALFLLMAVAGIGFAVRQVTGHMFRQMASKSLAAAIAINLLIAILAAWLGFEGFMLLLVAF